LEKLKIKKQIQENKSIEYRIMNLTNHF
jgi:hypothetical protein